MGTKEMRSSWCLWFVVTAYLLMGCKSEEESGSINVPDGQKSFVWNSDVCEQSIKLTGSGHWTAESNVYWCAPVKSSGNDAISLPIWVSPNITGEARSGEISIKCGGSTHTVKVSQPAFTGSLDSYVYHLPVVFHVLYNDASNDTLNVKQSRLADILSDVNKLYAANDMNVVFELAKYDKEGELLEEPGVIRHEVDFAEYDAGEFLDIDNKDNRQYADYALNLKKYVNVYLFRFKQPNSESMTMGITTLPIVPTAYPLDSIVASDAANDYAFLTSPWGVCINNAMIFETQDGKSYNPRYVVATMAHELGHFLGLLHTFSADECNNDDACSDTHISDYNNYVEQVTALLEQYRKEGRKTIKMDDVARRVDCNTGEEFIADNILDYTYTKNEKFTPQQFARTRHILQYGPLTPGPKLVLYNTTGKATRSAGHFPVQFGAPRPCPPVPVSQVSLDK